jgi:hypothetical protein
MGAVSDEPGERFYQDISEYEKTCSRKWSPDMFAGHCWSLIKEKLKKKKKKKKKKK